MLAGVVLVAGPSVAAPATSAHPAASRLQAGDQYVALGDSYAAGYGLPDPTGKPVAGCAQSSNDYPHRLAKALHLDLTDVSCAGATTWNVVSASQAGAPPQIDALSDATKLVTLTIGGNDANLFGTASSCLALTPTGPVFSGRNTMTCKSRLVHGHVDTLRKEIDGPVRSGVARAIAAVQKAAPNARIVMIGYPALFPDKAATPKRGCFRSALDLGSFGGDFPSNSFPFTNVDTRYLAGVQQTFDRVERSVATKAGVQYVSTLHATERRSACSTHGALVSGVTLTASADLQKVSLTENTLHPNLSGAAYLARRAEAAVVGGSR